jgi:hypothetical protein
MVVGIATYLSKNQKKQWHSFLISLGIYCLLNGKHALKEANQLGNILLACGNFKRHDLKGLVKRHYNMIRNVKMYVHEDSPFDIIF